MIWWLRAIIILTRYSFLFVHQVNVPVDITSHTLKHVPIVPLTSNPIPYIPYISFERLAPNVSHVNTRSSYTRVQWYHDISNAICGCIVIPILYTKDNELPWSFSHTLRVICIFLYFLCTYNHIEYCITCNNLDKMFPLLLLFTLTSFNVVFIAIVIHYTSLTQYLIKVVLFCYPCIKHSNSAWPMTYHMSIIVALSTGLYVLALPFVH